MESEKLYYRDAYLAKIETLISDIKEENGYQWLALRETIFYPGGGGQAADKGTINGLIVEKIVVDGDILWHQLAAEDTFTKGATVSLEIDWSNRFYNMQQHSGQHLLSYVFYKQGIQTVSVHLGESHTLIELEGGFPSLSELKLAENECNRFINKAIAIKTHWVKKKDIAKYTLRRAAADHEILRVVEIDKEDFSACGGTHLKNCSEIGLIKILGVEKIRGHARIKALIGQKAYDYFNQLHEIINILKLELPADIDAIPDRVKKIKDDAREQVKKKEFYRDFYINNLCDSLAIRDEQILFYTLKEGMEDDLQKLAACLFKKKSLNAFLCCGEKFCFVAKDDSKKLTDTFLDKHRERFAIRGGGPAGFIRGTIGIYREKELKKTLLELLTNI